MEHRSIAARQSIESPELSVLPDGDSALHDGMPLATPPGPAAMTSRDVG
jgi:hypothetical protein